MQFSAASLAKYGKKDGGEYEPESLAVMQSALDRHLKNAGEKHGILRDREFEKSTQQLQEKARELTVTGYGKRKMHLTLWMKKAKNSSASQVSSVNILLKLCQCNFKNLTEHFGLRGRQEHYSMMVEDFSIIAGLPRARSVRGTEPHTHRLRSTSFPLVVTWLTERTYASTDCTGGVGETIKRKGGVSQACLAKSTSFTLDIHNMVNWQLSKQNSHWPVSHDHIAGSCVNSLWRDLFGSCSLTSSLFY